MYDMKYEKVKVIFKLVIKLVIINIVDRSLVIKK